MDTQVSWLKRNVYTNAAGDPLTSILLLMATSYHRHQESWPAIKTVDNYGVQKGSLHSNF
jgi:hypothetical protein